MKLNFIISKFIIYNINYIEITSNQQFQVSAGWIISIASGLAVLYGLYEHNTLTPGVEPLSLAETVAYNTFQRAVWSAALGWLILACHWGYGGNQLTVYSINHICISHSFFLPSIPTLVYEYILSINSLLCNFNYFLSL